MQQLRGWSAVWVGGHSDAALRRALRFAEGWHGAGVDHVAVAGIRGRLAALGERVGRDPATLRLTCVCFLTPPGLEQVGRAPGPLLGGEQPSAASVAEGISLLQQAGISMCSLWMPIAASSMAGALDWIAEEIMPQIDVQATEAASTSAAMSNDTTGRDRYARAHL